MLLTRSTACIACCTKQPAQCSASLRTPPRSALRRPCRTVVGARRAGARRSTGGPACSWCATGGAPCLAASPRRLGAWRRGTTAPARALCSSCRRGSWARSEPVSVLHLIHLHLQLRLMVVIHLIQLHFQLHTIQAVQVQHRCAARRGARSSSMCKQATPRAVPRSARSVRWHACARLTLTGSDLAEARCRSVFVSGQSRMLTGTPACAAARGVLALAPEAHARRAQ